MLAVIFGVAAIPTVRAEDVSTSDSQNSAIESAASETEASAPDVSHSPTSPSSVHALIAKHATANGVPVALAEAIVRIESAFNAKAANHGALGLMQIKPMAARAVGFSGPSSALLHAETNLHYGMRYLAKAYRMSRGDTCGTVMRYQSGPGARRMSAANRAYCSKAKAIMARL